MGLETFFFKKGNIIQRSAAFLIVPQNKFTTEKRVVGLGGEPLYLFVSVLISAQVSDRTEIAVIVHTYPVSVGANLGSIFIDIFQIHSAPCAEIAGFTNIDCHILRKYIQPFADYLFFAFRIRAV